MTRNMNVYDKFTDIYSYIKNILFLTVLLTVGATSALAQDDLPGTYYIANYKLEENSGYYSTSNLTKNYYLCPTEGYVFFQSPKNYSTSDTGMPFLTTYKARNHDDYDLRKMVWIIKKSGDYYTIQHALTGKYITYNDQIQGTSNAGRMRFHLQKSDDPGDNMKFQINNPTGTRYTLCPKSSTSNSLNPAAGNKDDLSAMNAGTGGPTGVSIGGIVGQYASNNEGSQWVLEEAVLFPTITIDDATGKATITSEEGTTIRYALDDATPTIDGTSYTDPIDISDHTAIKAIAVRTSDNKVSVVATIPLKEYTYHILYKDKTEAIRATKRQAVGKQLGSSYTDIPAAIRSPYLDGETITFYNDADCADGHVIHETPSATSDIYVRYTTTHLDGKFLHLRGARALNVKINGELICDDNGSLSHQTGNENTTKPFLWYFSGEDPYAIEISNDESGKKLGYTTPSSSPTSLLYAESPEKTKFIIMATSNGDGYQQMELMAATGDGNYYRVGRTGDAFSISTTATGDASLQIKVNPVTIPATFKLIDKAGKILTSITSTSGDVELPDEWKSPLVSEYQYWKESAFTIEGDVYTLKAEPDESDKVTSVTDVSTIYVTYKVNDNVDFNTTADAESGSTYRLQFVNGESFYQENGKDAVMTEAQKGIYPYFCGDGMFYVYGNDQWNTQLNSGASTRSRWLWYVVSPTSDPYHVKIMSNQLNAKPIDTSHGYFRTFPVTYTDRQAGTEVTRYVTSLTTTAEDDGAPSPTEYMVLTGAGGHCKLVTVDEIVGAPTNGSYGTRQTVRTLEQYWKNNPTIQDKLGSAKVTQNETYSDNITLTSQQEGNLPNYWHTYQILVNSAPWVGWTGDNTGKGRQYKNKNHWFQTINMSATEGSDGEFEFVETTLTPQVILIDNHGWEIMRKPMYDKDGNVNSELKLYDSPMVKTYYWHPKSTKADGYHKYTVAEGDEQITIYTKNEAGKWVDSGDKTPHTSTSLFDIPYNHITPAQDKSVMTDFYVTYDVKPEYANLYKGAATEGDVNVSAFWVKQGTEYAKNEGDALATATVETDDDELKWNVKPNFNIDAEMGYKYNGEYGEKSKDETEAEYMTAGKNGFDPYNIQIQSVKNPYYYFKTTTTGSHLSGGWSGTSTDLILQQMSSDIQNNVEGNDQTKLNITNATFMVVKDKSGRMLLMPRFDHTKVVNSFTAPRLSAPNEATQSLELKMAPKVIHYSSEFASMNGQYFLAENFEFVEGFESLGTSEYPFTGSIDGGLHALKGLQYLTTPLITYANGAIIKNIILDNVTVGNAKGENEEDIPNVGAIVANATGETRIYNCGINGGSVGGTGDVGGIVGSLAGSSRVINCYSYATITGGNNVGGIVGNNKETTTAASIKTMVMNCMFYGDITGGSTVSPVFGGNNIANLQGGLNTFNYYAYTQLKTKAISNNKYNSALAVEDKFLNRFEYYRLLLNSNKKLAAFYASSEEETVKPSDMMKWVLETADRSIAEPKPYPVLKAQGFYPSIINYDVENAPDSATVGRNHGGKLGKTLSVTISGVGSNAPSGASITTGSLTLQRTDKDFDHFNFNYDKVQLPYYNDVGTGNYTKNMVVTGWKITAMSGENLGTDPYSSSNYPTTGVKDYPDHNYADRKSRNKDLYSVSNRVFSQGAYFDVPYGVTSITIEPYWGNAIYVADANYDVVYKNDYTGKQNVTQTGTQAVDNTTEFNGQKIRTSITGLGSGTTVYDNAVVLVGNFHLADVPTGKDGTTPFTMMSVDEDNDHEPDYSLIYHHKSRTAICPIRFDFLNIPGTAQAQKPNGASLICNFTIFKTKGWFEVTNTSSFYSSQLEYENLDGVTKSDAPLILQGGVIDQFVSTQSKTVSGKTIYIHVGGNVWIKEFGLGTHSDGGESTPHVPVSVTGGEFPGFYLTGTYNANAKVRTDNAECYISGGHFGEVAGASLEQIDGNVRWQIYDADIDNFFGGGINEAKPITGTVTTDIYNSHVTLFCGGPKFGNMQGDKKVTTNAEGCTFEKFFGAGYGGTSLSKKKYYDNTTPAWGTTLQGYYTTDRGLYFDGVSTNAVDAKYGKKGLGVATDFDYEFFVWSSGSTGGRFFVKFASFSLAQCNDVESNLKGCTINQSFYGGGSLGKVVGKATSVLDGCTVHGNVFGGGYSADIPTIEVRDAGFTQVPNYNSSSGMFEPAVLSGTTTFEWKNAAEAGKTLRNGQSGSDLTNHYIYTDADLTTLGQVKETDLTVKNNCLVEGAVYGGGDESAVYENTKVTIQNEGGSNKIPNVYGGGNTADVDGNTEVHMMNGTVSHDIYGGGRGETTIVGGNVMVNIGGKTVEAPSITYSGTGLVEGDVYGGSALGAVNTTDGKTTTVNVYGGTVNGSVFGGGLGQEGVAEVAESGTPGDPGYVAPQAAIPEIVALSQGNVLVNVEGGTVKTAVYGGSNINGVLQKDATVTLIGGTVGDSGNPNNDVVFGGGKGAPTLVNGDVTVNVGEEGQDVATGATIHGHVYGGGALGNTNEEWVTDTSTEPATTTLQPVANTKTLVNLYAGTINGYAYGGGLGDLASLGEGHADTPAYVGGDVKVTLDGAKVQQVFGANNINGTPKGHVKVWVKRTVNSAKPTEDGEHNPIGREGRTTYDVQAVYGGGNQADYIPSDASSAFTEVIIEGCELTSIDKVYGGGNAAAVPATKVTVKGSYIINTLYGGGNGAGEGNLGANVGYKSYSSLTPTEEEKTSKQYGTGKAETKLLGGYINDVYGGSNTRGDVRGGTDVRTKGKDEVVADCCETLNVGNIYGAGSHADVKGDANILLECMPEDYVAAVYGGAEEAIVEGNVTLTVTSGKFGRVFGGNNKGGSIQGSITVVAKEEGCKPLEIGELYGGGNEAPYSHFGCTKVGEGHWTPNTSGTDYTEGKDYSIEVIVESCTSIGKVFGGGNEATVIGNTHVDINLFRGLVEGNPDFRPLGKIGQVFGGGNLAKVTGNTTVDIGTDGEYVNPETSTVDEGQKKGVKIESGDNYLKTLVDDRQTITAGIYGGGNDADVEGNTTLNIGTAYQTLGININGDIFGGGLGKDTHVTGNVTVNIGTNAGTVETPNYVGYAQITGDVYGGSAKGTVNSADNVNATTDSYTKVNFYGGTIKDTDTPSGKGNIYGGGEGQIANPSAEPAIPAIAANVFGPVTVTTFGGTVNKVFGCNNYFGAPQNTVDVFINGGTVNNSVYGGGNLAAYSAPGGSPDYPAVHINHGTVTENVFGGGYGLSAVVTGNPHITIGDGVEGHVVAIKKSVYGGGELAGVTGDTYIVMNNGTVGTPKDGETVYAGAIYGNIYGGGLGTEDTSKMTEAQAVQQAGIIKGNTNVTVKGGTVLHNIYGGGANGSVGTFTYDGNNVITGYTSGGVANITILGGTIGTDGHENGMIFGASRGDVGKPGEIQDKLAWVYDTNVTIGNNTSANPQIKGSVYGSGENGHTYHDAAVTIHSGMVGITDVSIDGGAAYPYRGNVYGGGCGTDKYWVDANSNGVKDAGEEHYNLTAGIVGTTTALGTTTVTIDGGHVVRNVYGGGAMGSVTGGTTVNISGKSVIGADGSGGGYVYAASRGYDDMEAGFATVGSTTLNISGGTIWQSAFGGGQLGTVKGSVAVNVSGGVVKNDVYGGGALANTNTDNWNGNGSIQYVALTVKADPTAEELAAGVLKTDVTPVAGYFTEAAGVYTRITNPDAKANGSTTYYKKAVTGTWADGKTSASNTTTVSLTGGLIGNAYGGGLGNSTTMANVYGDVTVEVNKGVADPTKGIVFNQLTEHAIVGGTDYPTPVMGRVFGCNNYNGTPTGEVTVHVYSTRQIKKDTEGEILPGHGSTNRKFSYEIQSVYGGGNQADYLPATGKKSHVIIEGCDETSIEKVYGGCNSAVIPETDVLIKGCYDIGYGFGGGNGGRPIKKENGNWYENEGAIVIGTARIECQGGKIGQVFGGGDSKGSCGSTNPVIPAEGTGTCPLWITRLYGAGNEGDVTHVNIILAACSGNAIEYVHGGSYNAHVHGNVNLTITSGILKNVYGGNDSEGGIEGDITVNIEETDGCNPIIIQNLVGGGNEAAYPGTLKPGGVETPIDRHGKITVNVKSATRIDNIYGGSFNAEADADTEININMMRGNKAGTTVDIPKEFSYIPNISGITNNPDGKTIHCTIDDAIGTIGNVFGGGKQGIVKGNTQVNINSSAKVYIMKRDGEGRVLDTSGNPITTTSGQNIPDGITIDCTDEHNTEGAHITGDVFGGGENADVTGSERASDKGNTFVNICANPDTYAAVAEGAEKVTIDESVYGGGSEADVHGNTTVTMAGGYVYDGVYGGGLKGSVGTFTRTTSVTTESNGFDHSTHAADCLGKPTACADGTGTCTVVVSGGQVGPVEVATKGMKNTGGDGPVDVGFVFGAGRGDVENPNDVKDADFHTYVDKTDVTISGGLIMASVYGGGENGRVLHDTHVTISGGQIGCGEAPGNVPKVYSESDWNSETPATFKECLSWDYKAPFLPHDPYAQTGDTEDAKEGTDGHTYYGSVFGGGSGYYPYLIKNIHGSVTGHEWLRSAGAVYGNTVIDITGGHILTCVYGGNETTDVGTYSNNAKGQPLVHVSGGKCTINMVGGTLGVPRTDKDAQDHPVTCYLFGAGKGDQRTSFNTWTNVQETEVNVSGTARIFGSVFGGGEDGHVLGDAQVNIGGSVTIGETTYTAQSGLKIGTTGTSYVDGNVFGGGRGFSGLALTAGSTGGNAEVNIAGGTMLGSIYGGGRLASVGIDFTPPTDPLYGQLVDDNEKTHGHIAINISGGTIGTTTETGTAHPVGGNVFGGSMGRITLLDESLNPLWPKQAVTKDTEVTITGGEIKNSVYGGSEYGIVRDKATVTVSGGTINGSVYGGGYGSDDTTPTFITAGDYASGLDYVFTPMIWTGCVSGDTEVNIAGGTVEKNVYGGGEVASVGLINCHVVEDANGDIIIKDEHNVEKKYRYTNLTKHADIQGTGENEKAYGFALSWPYKFEYIPADPKSDHIGGKATVNVTGGHIGSTTWDDRSGYVFGGSKGQVAFKKKVGNDLVNITDIHEQRYVEGLCANVRETEVNVNYGSTPSGKTPSNIGAEDNCIMGAVYGGGEDGHVYENAAVNITGGLIGLSVYGGGKGEGTYTGTKYVYNESTKEWTWTENVANMPSWTAGKIYGNTSITMSNGHVMGNVYGGGNLGSVGKGNYAGGTDDYYPAGYGETLTGNLWDNVSDNSKAFLASGKCTISITGGTVGTLNGLYGNVQGTSKGTPTGIVFGGSRGRAAQDVGRLSPRYEYAPDFFLGYVNNTEVTIGTRNADSGPRIYSQVFGGARDGHVRGSAKVEVNSGIIGQAYDVTQAVGDADVDYQRYHRGNVYGAGSGLGTWDGTHHGTSSGSVTRNTTVDIYGGTIYNNVYGGGAMATVGPPAIPPTAAIAGEDWSKCTVNIYGGTIGNTTVYDTHKYGGTVYGGSRGDRGGDYHDLAEGETIENYATVLWTEVNINPHPSDRTKDAVIAGNVYGGARGGQVKKDTKVNLTGGVIKHNAYGGGRGTTIPADVLGNTTTELNKGVAADAKGCIVDKVFGCNDLNGTPKGHVLVHVYGTQNRDKGDMQTKVGPGSRTSLDQGESEGYIVYMNRLIELAKDDGVVKPGITASVITDAEATITGKEEGSLSDGEKTAISNEAKKVITELQKLQGYDVTAVYGGGDLAPYIPTVSEDNTEVIIEGCDVTSIQQVYGGGNAAYVPATNVLVKSAYVIDELFGGGNGLDNYKKATDGKWYENPGANVGYKQLAYYDTSGSHGTGADEANKYTAITYTDPDATTKAGRIANYSIGTGVASTTVNGGYIHSVYGGSNKKGNIRREALLQIQQVGTCPLITDKTYAGSKEAPIDAETNTVLDCVREGNEFYGGSQNADILNDVHVRITNGHYKKVFGGNEKAGTITGSITIDIEENGCTPIEIDELYAGGYFAPYSVYGYAAVGEPAVDKDGNAIKDKEGHQLTQRRPLKKGDTGALATPSRDPQINIISATKIGKIYGGGYAADLIGSPHINVNMTTGRIREKYASEYTGTGSYPYITATDAAGNKIIPVGVIGTIFGGGNKGDIYGDTYVEIGTGEWLNFAGKRETTDDEGKVYTYNSTTKKWDWTKTVGETTTSGTEDNKPAPSRNKAFVLRDGTGGQVFGGGDQGYVFGNTNVNIGNGYIYDRVYGGGNEGTVGTVLTRALPEGHSHTTGCLGGKPTAFATGTGKSTVTVSGGYVGPYSYVRSASTGTATITPMTMPQDFGYVFAAGRGKMGNPAVAGNEDIEFMTYVNETNVIIKNTYAEAFEGDSLAHIVRSPLIAGGVYGGSENGRVLNNTHVNIWGGQIGLGATKTAAYAEADFIDPTTATAEQIAAKAATMAECASWAYGHDSNSDSKNDEWLPYDEHAGNGHYQTEAYGAASTTGYDGHTFYGNVFGGGSGYFAYETDTEGVYEWLPSAGLVEGDTYVNISGGHILTNVYGGNEMTNVTGTAHVTMTGGTLGVPRTLARIAEHPVTCYLFGAGKGDQRVHFNKSTNVGHAKVNVSGGIIYGSVFGGGEDGHVLGDVTMNISDGAKIGTWGTSYVDGNVFGGGRGFGGDAYTAGNVAGSVTLNITGGTMLGSVYGGGRLGSVGYGLFSKNETGYGEMMADNATETGFVPVGGLTHGRGHVTVNISGDNTVIGNKYEYQNVPTDVADLDTWKTANHVPQTAYETTTKTVDATTQYIHRLKHTRGGNVFAGGMGRYTLLDGTPISTYNEETGALTSPIEWKKLGNVKSTKLTISGNPWIMGNVYGGGEYGAVQGSHQRYNGETPMVDAESKPIVASTEILFSGGTVGTEITTTDPTKETVENTDARSNVQYTFGSIYGGGMGQEDHDATDNHGGTVKDSTYVSISGAGAKVRASVFGGGEMAIVDGNATVTVSGGKIGRDEVKPATDVDAGYVLFGGATMGNVYGGGKGILGHTKAGLVKGNTNVTISGGNVYHNVYGGGALGSVGTFSLSNGTDTPSYIPIAGVPYNWTANTGTATVTITGGTIGISGRDNGLVFGSSRGDLQKPVDEDPGEGEKLVDPYDRVAWVNKSVVTIGTSGSGTTLNTPLVKGSVYGGGENGHNNESATVNVYSGTIGVTDTEDPWYSFTDKELEKEVQLYRGNVYGAGSGSDTYTGDDGKEHYNPKSGMVGGNTFVNIAGGHVGRAVYGGGAMASVGTITSETKHGSIENGFGLSWPYAFEFAANTGKATVNVTGGHIGTRQLEGGDVYGSSRGVAGDRYDMANLALTNETEVNITYPETIEMTSEAAIQNDFTKQCITGAVHGSGENGYVYGDTHVTLNKGLIGHSLYGGGKGKGTYTKTLNNVVGSGTHEAKIYSLIAGKVMGNTYVTMLGGRVGRNVYGGGNMGSVGKGNYAGGTDDYVNDCPIGAAQGYGEKIEAALWTPTPGFDPKAAITNSNKPTTNADYFLSSGIATVNVISGTVGYIDSSDPTVSMKNQLPYGNVIGGSAGEAAPNIADNPRYEYSPAFFSGYVNETDVTIGGYRCKTAYTDADSKSHAIGDLMTAKDFENVNASYAANWEVVGPTIYASVYGGGQDGHVRRDTKVTVLDGEIGVPYESTSDPRTALLKTYGLDDSQWMHRGNVYGGGSGITEYKYDFNGDGDTADANEQDYSNSSGSVTRFTEVNIMGGIIHRNVYGGGSMGSVGAPNMGQTYVPYKPGQANIDGKPANGPGRQSMNTINIGGGKGIAIIGTPFINDWKYNKTYGGEVYGASRGMSTLDSEEFSTSVWTKITVKNGATIMGNVYGGGDNGAVKKDTDVQIGAE